MKLRSLVTVCSAAACLLLSACSDSGNVDTGPDGKGKEGKRPVIPGPVIPVRPQTVISTLSDEQIVSIHACLLNAWGEASEYWSTLGGAELSKCLSREVRLRESDLTAQFEIDFMGLYSGLHDESGKVVAELSVRDVRRKIKRGG